MTTLFAAAAMVVGYQQPKIDSYVQSNFEDASMVAVKVFANQPELKKINDDFGQSYRFDSTHFQIKEPFMLRGEAKADETSVVYVINGESQTIRLPRTKFVSRQDLTKSPGRRQTVFDFGLLTPSLFRDYMVATFVRNDRATGDVVFDVTYNPARFTEKTRYRIWVDADKKIVNKREWYDNKGRMKATFFYESPVKVDGVWLPTKMSVKNVDDKLAGVLKYEAFKVNSGLSDSLFK